MTHDQHPEIAYILKMFPRFSQTFVLNELLAHEEAGLNLEIFSLRLSDDTRFHESLARVRSPVRHIFKPPGKANYFLADLRETYRMMPGVMRVIEQNPMIPAGDMQQAMSLARAVRARGIRHLHAHFGTIATTVSRLAADMADISYSWTAHAKDIFHESVDAAHFRKKLEDAATVVTVSNYNLEYLSSKHPAAAGHILHIDNGLDLEQFTYDDPGKREPLVLGVGRLVEKKGFSYLLDAFSILRKKMPRARCEIIGDGVLREDLQKQVSELGLAESLSLLGPQPQGEVRRKLRKASVIAAPCIVASDGDRDGLPTVLLEAMAIGTPIVSTDVTGIPEILEDDVTGLAVPQRDAARLGEACLRLIRDGDLRTRLSKRARQVVEERFDIRKNSVQLRALFKQLLAEQGN